MQYNKNYHNIVDIDLIAIYLTSITISEIPTGKYIGYEYIYIKSHDITVTEVLSQSSFIIITYLKKNY